MSGAGGPPEAGAQRGLFPTAAALGGLLLGLAVLEIGLRVADPTPHVQVIRPADKELRLLDGAPVWRAEGSEPRENVGCAPHGEGQRWLLLGSSILFGSGLSPQESPGAQLQAALGEGHCVHNYAQPAFTFSSQAAIGQEAVAARQPSQVIWEIWENSPTEFVVAGDTAYNLHGFVTGPDGLPSYLNAPAWLNRWLLPRSRTWETLALRSARRAVGERMGLTWRAFAEERLRPALEALIDQGITPTLYLAPTLERPFAERRDAPSGSYLPVLALAEALGVRALRGELLLADQDVEAVRLDPCCHLNARGAQLLAEALSIELTENPPPEDRAASPPAD